MEQGVYEFGWVDRLMSEYSIGLTDKVQGKRKMI